MAARKVCYRGSFRYFSFLLLLLFFTAFASAAERYVYPQQQYQQQSLEGGLSLNFAGAGIQYPNIQAAIDDACDGDIIYLAKGRFTGFGNRDLDFNGKAITVSGLDPNDPCVVAATIIDCNGSETDKHRGFYFHSGEDNNSVLCGITVTNGLHDYGGAILCEQSSPLISHCILTANTAYQTGSAVRFYRSYSVLTDCEITGNKTGSAVSTAGYYGDSNSLLIQNCIIKDNNANQYKGGITCEGPTVEIINCRIEGNKSFGVMGGYGVVKISNCQIVGNGTIGSRPYSGIYNDSRARITVKNSAIIGNFGTGIRGCEEINNCFIGYNSGNGLEYCTRIKNSKIIGNGGEGINRPVGYYGPPLITNCVIAKNKGRGIYYYGSTQNLSNCTIVENGGAGVEIYNSSPSITNCIIRDNFDEQIKGATETTKITYTNSYKVYHVLPFSRKGPYPGVGNIDTDPCFVSELDWHLMPGSACIDAGTNDPNYVTEPNDIEGSTRIIDGDGDDNAVADMGAYEYNSQRPVIAAWAERIVWFKNIDQQIPNKMYIKNAGVGVLNYEIESDYDWLTIIPSQGASGGQIQEADIIIDVNKVELGDYFCRLRIYDQNAANSPLDYWLTVHIGSLWIVPSDFNTIQEAIDEASEYDHICVLDGTYTGQGNTDVNFSGKDVVLYSAGGAENCIIDCQQTANGFRFISGETSEAILDGFSIINAGAKAVYCDAYSGPIITNCIIADTNRSGYGIYMQNYCRPTITNCRFEGDQDYYFAVCGRDSAISVYDCEFSNNGIAVYARDCQSVVLKDCNITSSSGVNCSETQEVSIENCVIQDGWDGIYLDMIGQGEISNCILTGNGDIMGGGMDVWFSNIVVQNCLLTGNSIGCTVLGGLVSFENCTFTENYSYSEGSTLWCYGNSEVNFVNCILWDEGNSIHRGGEDSIDISYSDVRGGWEGVGNINEDPCFVEPGYRNDNNTPNDTYDDFWVDGDYHLQSFGWRWDPDRQDWGFDRRTSRCIDAGSPGYPLGDEPLTVPPDPHNLWGENLRIDMGYYGGTAEASMPPYNWALLSDMDNSGEVDFADYSYLANYYGQQGEKLSGDLNRDGKVDFADISLIADDWLDYTDWAAGR